MKFLPAHCYPLCGLMIVFGLAVGVPAETAAKTIQFTVPIEPEQAVPQLPPLSTASGTASFTLNLPDNPGDDPTLDYFFQFSGLDLGNLIGFPTNEQTPGDSDDDVTAVHIHNGAIGSTGPMFLGVVNPNHDFGEVNVNIPASTISGTWDNDFVAGKTLFSEALDELLAGQLYLNIHTVGNPGSAIRAQIVLSVPEPAAIGLGAFGLALFTISYRRRVRRAGIAAQCLGRRRH